VKRELLIDFTFHVSRFMQPLFASRFTFYAAAIHLPQGKRSTQMIEMVETKAPIYRVELTDDEIQAIQSLTKAITARYDSVEEHDFLCEAVTYAQELPRSLRARLNAFRLAEPSGICLVTGYPIDDRQIGPTPAHWKAKPVPAPTLREDLFFFLCAALLGDPIGWATQQDGYILHDVMPIKGHEQEQLGTGSEVLLTWHTEDAFHPYRADYIGLMCLRNPDQVETTYAMLDQLPLDAATVQRLFEPRFLIRPDESHLPKNRSGAQRDLGASEELLRRSYARINQMNRAPEKIAVFSGDPASPYARLDPYFMDRVADDPAAMAALDTLVAVIDAQIRGLALQPGEIMFIDNAKVVHGRVPFTARYDGSDRWLHRLNIARDLRKSRDARRSAEARIIF
jgi:enduracididine beta-hydroxylase